MVVWCRSGEWQIPDDILDFWLDGIGPDGWYAGGEDLDATIRDLFEADWRRARDGALSLWLTYPSGTLAYIILTDQFPRNMFRESAQAFELDKAARAAAKMAIAKGWDMRIDEPARQFFYLPLMHSENLADQDRCVRLMMTRGRRTSSRRNILIRAATARRCVRFRAPESREIRRSSLLRQAHRISRNAGD